MRITVLTVAYNEEKMIGRFLEHYIDLGVSRIVVYDNMSTDRTVEICKEVDKKFQGRKIEVVPYNTQGQIRDDVYLQIKNEAWKKYKSDYFIVVDCDEYLEVNLNDESLGDDKKRLVRYLSTMKKGYVLPKVLGVQVVTDSFDELENGLGVDDLKMYVMDETFNKRCLFSRKLAPTYRPGCHSFVVPVKNREVLQQSLEAEKAATPLYLFHLKHVDLEYVTNRYAEFKTRLSKYNKDHGYGHQYEMTGEAVKLKFDYLKRYAITLNEVFEHV